jgi:hypothetical protein
VIHLLLALVSSPHLALAAEEVPDLLDRVVTDGHGRLPLGKCEVSQAARAQAEEDTDLRPVRCHHVSLGG